MSKRQVSDFEGRGCVLLTRCKLLYHFGLRLIFERWHIIRFPRGSRSLNLHFWLNCHFYPKVDGVVGLGGTQFGSKTSNPYLIAGQERNMAKKASASGTRIVPLGDRVVLKRAEAEEKTAGGILLPDAAKNKPQRGEVVSVGDGHVNDKGERIPLSVKEGDRVIFSSYAGDEITVGDKTFLLMRESDILATL